MSQLNEAEKLQKLESLIAKHDLTHVYSDDPTAYERGTKEYIRIQQLIDTLEDKSAVAPIWNKWVDRKIAEQFAESWYWGVHNEY